MTNPITLPAIEGYEQSRLIPRQPKNIARMEGRRSEEENTATFWWEAQYRTPYLTAEEIAIVDSWLVQMASGGSTFLAYDFFRPRPRLMDTGSALSGTKAVGGSFNGTANLSIVTSSTRLVIDDLPAGFIVSTGDWLEVNKSALVRSLHLVTVGATSNAGGTITIDIKPALDTNAFTAIACSVQFEKPSCVMIVLGNPSVGRGRGDRVLDFKAQEVFYQ